MREYLPIGSVVLLDGGTKKVMIIGRLQKQSDNGQIWDYSGCLYPEGVIDPSEMYLFNNSDIDRLYFIGMQDAEELQFRGFLAEQAEELLGPEEEE